MPPRQRKEAPAKSLEATLWQAADKLRGNLEAAECKHVVLGLVFLKYVSDAFTQRRTALEATPRRSRLTAECRSPSFSASPRVAPDLSPSRREAYARAVRPLPQRQDSLSRESMALVGLRNALLPELMSGRIRVPEARAAVEEEVG